jgi:hypothetical protein
LAAHLVFQSTIDLAHRSGGGALFLHLLPPDRAHAVKPGARLCRTAVTATLFPSFVGHAPLSCAARICHARVPGRVLAWGHRAHRPPSAHALTRRRLG